MGVFCEDTPFVGVQGKPKEHPPFLWSAQKKATPIFDSCPGLEPRLGRMIRDDWVCDMSSSFLDTST